MPVAITVGLGEEWADQVVYMLDVSDVEVDMTDYFRNKYGEREGDIRAFEFGDDFQEFSRKAAHHCIGGEVSMPWKDRVLKEITNGR
jgi:hypothetical protein